MRELSRINNTWQDDKVIDACSIFGMMDTSGKRFSGRDITTAIANMHDRGNGLGGGQRVVGDEVDGHTASFLSSVSGDSPDTLLPARGRS